MTGKNKPVLIGRPKSDSFEDWKAFMIEMSDHVLGKGAADEMTDEDWRESWELLQKKKAEKDGKK